MVVGRCRRPVERGCVTPAVARRDFEYTPKAEFYGPFAVFNEVDERASIRRFFDHIQVCVCVCVVRASYEGWSDWKSHFQRREIRVLHRHLDGQVSSNCPPRAPCVRACATRSVP